MHSQLTAIHIFSYYLTYVSAFLQGCDTVALCLISHFLAFYYFCTHELLEKYCKLCFASYENKFRLLGLKMISILKRTGSKGAMRDSYQITCMDQFFTFESKACYINLYYMIHGKFSTPMKYIIYVFMHLIQYYMLQSLIPERGMALSPSSSTLLAVLL